MEKYSKILFLIVFLVLLSTAVISFNNESYTGKVTNFNNLDALLENQETAKEKYNNYAEELPSLLMEIFGNEVIEAQITRYDNSTLIKTLKTERGLLTEIDNITEEPSLIVEVNESVVESILNSDNHFDEFENAVKDNKIKYSATRLSTRIKTTILNAFLRISSIFG